MALLQECDVNFDGLKLRQWSGHLSSRKNTPISPHRRHYSQSGLHYCTSKILHKHNCNSQPYNNWNRSTWYVLKTGIFGRNVCVTVQRFPLKDEELLRKWLVGMRMEDFVPSTKSILCSDHFDKSCFFHRGNIRLKSDAVPTIFLHEKRKGIFLYIYTVYF